VIVSPRAFYLNKAAKIQMRMHGGLIGGIITPALARAPDTLRTCYLGELAPGVQQALNPSGMLRATDVIVLPKEAVSLVKFQFLNNEITVRCGNDYFLLPTSLFKGPLRRFVVTNNWRIGTPINPVAGQVHGSNFGLPEPRSVRSPIPVGERIVRIAGAIIILAILIALSALFRRSQH
jgi:hypothetical protein